jgi:hypothetical protein
MAGTAVVQSGNYELEIDTGFLTGCVHTRFSNDGFAGRYTVRT